MIRLKNWLAPALGVGAMLTTLLTWQQPANAATPGFDGELTVTSANQVINQYADVTAIDTTAKSITVDDIANLTSGAPVNGGVLVTGDLLMLYQAQGATIDTTNTDAYGNVTAYNNAGKYQFVTVGSISGNTITLSSECGALTAFDPDYTQVIRMPQLSSLSVSGAGSITAATWNGTTGGVVVADVSGATTLSSAGAINVNALGFRGAAPDTNASTSGVGAGVEAGYRYATDATSTAKGEGIASPTASLANGGYGRGAPANGGGGGNGHNGGGGGGSNGGALTGWNGTGTKSVATANWANAWELESTGFATNVSPGGGRGGYTYFSSDQDALTLAPGDAAWGGDQRDNVGGFGGRPLDTSGNRAFLGGGGGAGEWNGGNAAATVGGGNGGGLVYLTTGSLAGTGTILANGGLGGDSGATDSASGGGGGGAILIESSATAPAGMGLNANGGLGGSQAGNGSEGEGPGGGGGGGYIAVSGGSKNATGGANGTSTSTLITEFTPNGATMGSAGTTTATPPTAGSLSCFTPRIGIAKEIGTPVVSSADKSTYDIPYTIRLTSYGENLTGVTVIDNLANTFPGATLSITAGPTLSAISTGSALTLNTAASFLSSGNLVTAGNLSRLADGTDATATISFTVRVRPAAGTTSSTVFNNTATANGTFTPPSGSAVTVTDTSDSGTNPDTNGNRNANESGENDPTITSLPIADLSLSKTGPASATFGSNIVFTLSVSNATGSSTATGVQVRDQLPTGYTYVSDNGAGAYVSGTGVWTVPNIAAGTSATLQITATVNPTGVYTNTAQVSASGLPDPDSLPNNSLASEDDQASSTPSVASPSVAITGKVWNDLDANLTINGSPLETGTNAGGLNVYAVNSLGKVVEKASVGVDGTYTLAAVPANIPVVLRLSTVSLNLGDTAPLAPSLPSAWFNTGENANGTPDFALSTLGDISLTTSSNLANQNFGVRQSYTLTPPPAPNTCQFDFSSYLNTGISSGGGQLATGSNDLRWTAEWIAGPSSGPATPYATPRPVGVMPAVVSGNAAPGAWLNEPANARWISYPFRGPNNSDGIHADADLDGTINEGNAAFVGSSDAVRLKFTTYLTLPAGANLAALNVPLRVAVDNEFVSATVNGVANISNPNPNPYAADYGAFATIPLNNGWQAGVNTIEITVDSGPNAVGFLIALDGTATQLCAALSGTVWDDRNGNVLIDTTPVETGTNAGGLFVYAVGSSNKVVAKTAVTATTGAYTLNGLAAGSYTLRLSTDATATIGNPAPAASSLPSGWVNTGERNASGTETVTPGDIAVTVASSDLGNLNFGIEQPPTANIINAASQSNPGGTTQVTVPNLGGSDPEDGTLGSGSTIIISSLATNGTLFYNGSAVLLGQVITAYDPSLLKVDPNDGAVTVSFTYAVRDAALKDSPAVAVTMPFSSAPPLANAINNASILSSAGNTAIDSLTGSDADGTVVSFRVTTLPLPSQGVLKWDDDNNAATPPVDVSILTDIPLASANKLFFDPSGTFSGNLTFPYTATDNSGLTSSPAIYTIPVGNTPPTANPITNPSIPSSAADTSILSLTGSDPDGTVVSFNVTTLPLISQGVLRWDDDNNAATPAVAVTTLTVIPLASADKLFFDPAPTFTGDASFAYTATDNSNATSSPASYTIPIGNTPPIANPITNPSINSTAGDTGILSLTGSDTDGTVVSFKVTTFPPVTQGTLKWDDDNNAATPAVAVLPSSVIPVASAGKLFFDPSGTYTGDVTFTYIATDNSSATSSPAIYTIPIGNNPPTASNSNNPSIPNSNGPTSIGGLQAADTDGTVLSFTITALPPATQGALTKADGTPVNLGDVLDPTEAANLKFVPNSGYVGDYVIGFTAKDNNAGVSNAATLTIPVTAAATIAGTVWDDKNGDAIRAATGEPGTNPGLNAVLTDSSGKVLQVVAIASNGTYSFAGIAPNTDLKILISTGAPAINSNLSTSSVPTGWTTTSPTVLAFNSGAASATGKDFGIEQLPVTDDKTLGEQINPPGNTRFVVPTLTANDPEDGALSVGDTFQITQLPSNGKLYYNGILVLLNDVIASYDPSKLSVDPDDAATSVVFKVAAIDAANKADPSPATVTMAFKPGVAPIATADATTTPFNTSVNLDPKSNDIPSAGTTLDPLKIDLNPSTPAPDSSVTTANGTFNLIASGPDAGKVTFTPNPGFVGTATTPYTIQDNLGQTSNAAQLKVDVLYPPAPVAVDDSTGTPFNTAVIMDLKLNDDASVGTSLDPLKIDLDPSTPGPDSSISTTQGTFELITTGIDAGKVRFTPTTGFTGAASTPYTIKDSLGQTSNSATITVTVTAPGAPVAKDDNATTPFNTSVNLDPKLNDTSSGGTTLDASKIDLNPATAAQDFSIVTPDGTFTLITSGPDAGKVSFAPNPGFVGTASTPYTIKDSLNQTSNAAILKVVVTNPPAPIATNDGTTTTFNTPVNLDPKINDTASAGTTLNPLKIDLDPSTPAPDSSINTANGTFTLITTGVDAGKVTFAPNPGFTGTASIPYTIQDSLGQTSNNAILSVVVGNPPAPVAKNDVAGTPFNTPVTVDAKTNDTSSPGTTLDPAKIDLNPATPDQDLTFTTTQGTFDLITTGPDAGKVKFTPVPGFTGTASIPYTIKDNLGQTSNPATITVTVANPGAPVANDDGTSTAFNTAVNLDPKTNDTSSGGTTVDASTIDLDPSTPVQDPSVITTQGTFALITSGPDAGKVKFTPVAGFVGTATAPYTIKDSLGQISNQATLSVIVNNPAAPVAKDDSSTTAFNTPVNLDAPANDTSSTGTTLDASKIDLNPATAAQDSSIVTPDGTFTLITSGPDAGKVTFAPVPGFVGTATTPYTIKDSLGQTSNAAILSVVVGNPAAPAATNDTIGTPFNTAVTIDAKSNDTSSVGTSLNPAKIDLNPATPGQDSSVTTTEGTFVLITSGPDAGKVKFTPVPGFTGTASVPYTIQDNLGQTSNTATITVTVAAPNAPTAQPDTANTALNTAVTIDPKANDSAAGGATLDPLKIDLNPSTPDQDPTVTTAQGTFTLITSGPDAGKVTFTPATGFVGTASVPYTIKDNAGTTSNTSSITVTVAAPNAPVATNDTISTAFNTPVNVPVTLNDSAAAGATLDPSTIDLNPATPGPDSSVTTAEGTFTLITSGPDAGKVTFAPVAGFTGTVTVPYTIKDNFGATSNSATIKVTVNPPAAPIATDDATNTPLNTAVNLDPKTNDTSSSGTTLDPLKIDLNPAIPGQDSSIVTADGTFSLISSGVDAGKVKFTPNPGFTGTASTPYTIQDNLGQTSNQANLRVTVIGTPTVVKSFASSTVAADGTVAMSITISNPNGSVMNGVAFSDAFPTGLEIATAPSAAQCGGTVSSTATSLSLSAGTIPANSSCTINATVKATKIGAITNVLPAGAVTTSNAGSSPAPASATLETASVGAAKSASVINNGDGTYNITYLISLENLGSVPLTNVQAIENFENTFTGAATWSLVGSPSITGGTGLTLNPSFTGRVAGSTNLLNAASSGLAINATATLSVTVRVNPNGNPATTTYNNQVKATASGNGPGGATPAVTDLSSNSGTNPDPNGNGNPNDPGESDPTGVSFNENPSIGTAKSAGALTSNGNGTYTQAFSVIVRNYGDVPLTNLSVTENLSSVFGTALVSTGNLNVTGAAGVTANAGFNGNAQTNLAATGSTLAVGATATFSFDVVIRPSATAFSFTNSVTARGSSPAGSIIADDSVNGLDPNPTPGSPNNDTSGTPIVFAKITGHVFSDINGDGTQQAGEPNLNANTVTITPASGPAFTVLTDSNGDYTAIVPAGSTSVSATAPAGNLVTTANNPQTITAVAGSSKASTPVGFQPKGTIKGHVWTDRDFSGIQEPGEPNLAQTDVTIVDSSGTTQVVKTDANGDYSANVPFGPVTVTVSKPAGSRLSTNNNPQTITVTDSSVRTLSPVGFHPDGLVSGVIFEDTNGNGVQDPGENGLLGIPVKITDVQGTVTTVLTDKNGAYSLNVPAGATTIAVTTPGGTILTTANATQTVTAIGKTDTPAAKIGFQPQNKVVGHVFNDPNGNGIQDAGETNIANQDVKVTDSSGAVQTVKTNATGDYVAFVIPGKTSVNVVDPTGSSLTTANDPQDVTVLAGQTGTATPVGFQARGTISGHLFNDIDGNGTQDPGEPNLPGLTVTITDVNGKVVTLISDANGDYTTSVPVGPTNISVTGPNGSSVTTGNNPQTVTVPVAGNVSATPTGFQVPTGSLTGRVFTDTNGNGVLDNGEQGIAGAKVTVLDSSGQSFGTTTDANGNYSVPNLATGTAKITVTDPSGLALTTDNNPQDVTIASGSSTSAANVGYVKPSLQLSKKALSPTVAIGEILEYELTVTNSSPIDVRDVEIIDELPLGLAYKAGSSTVANLKLEPKLGSKNGRQILTWTVPGILTPNASSTIKFATIVTPSATQKLENVATASAIAGAGGASTLKVAAQSAVATTKIVQAVFNNKSVFVGRVYFDRDRDANFTSGIDVPLAGARVYLSDGRYAITDAQGRYSVPDITPGVYVVRLDRLTAPYTPVRVPTDVGLPGTRRVDAQGGLYEANFPLLEPDASVAKERETMVERGSVKLEKILERIPSDQSSTEKPGYVIRETITVSKTIANLTITDPLPQSGTNQSSPGATRGPILLVGSDGKEITVKLLEDGRIQIPGKLEAGTYTLVYAIYTTLTPDQVVTDPSINYDEVIR